MPDQAREKPFIHQLAQSGMVWWIHIEDPRCLRGGVEISQRLGGKLRRRENLWIAKGEVHIGITTESPALQRFDPIDWGMFTQVGVIGVRVFHHFRREWVVI